MCSSQAAGRKPYVWCCNVDEQLHSCSSCSQYAGWLHGRHRTRLLAGGASHVLLAAGSRAKPLKAADADVDQLILLAEFEKGIAENSLQNQILSGLSRCLALYRTRGMVPRRVRLARKRNSCNSSNELHLRLHWSVRSVCCRAIRRGLRRLLHGLAPLHAVDAGV